MINWPETLVREIVKERCVFFLGAGVSATAKDDAGNSPPTWTEFLNQALTLVQPASKRNSIKKLIKQGNLLIALQAIRDNCALADFRRLLDETFNNPHYVASDLHKIILDLDARIVVTTNFDKIYERYAQSYVGGTAAFKVIEYESSDLADEIRSDTRLIVKAHGSIDRISKMIFTRAQYHQAKRNHSSFYQILKSIFLTNTIVFVGCGLEDPDIMLLLEDVQIVGRHEKPHYALVRKGSKSPFLVEDWITTYNIQVFEFGPAFSDLIPELRSLLERVSEARALLTPGLS